MELRVLFLKIIRIFVCFVMRNNMLCSVFSVKSLLLWEGLFIGSSFGIRSVLCVLFVGSSCLGSVL